MIGIPSLLRCKLALNSCTRLQLLEGGIEAFAAESLHNLRWSECLCGDADIHDDVPDIVNARGHALGLPSLGYFKQIRSVAMFIAIAHHGRSM